VSITVDVGTVLTALISFGALVIAIVNRRNLNELHVSINSRLTELMDKSGALQRAEGHREGREEAARDKSRGGIPGG
jgi:hypothetical protein